MKKRIEVAVDPVESAKEAGLRYVSDQRPGIERKGPANRFRYVDKDGPVRDSETLTRIKSLVIPPAWTEVWICPDPNGHLQVRGAMPGTEAEPVSSAMARGAGRDKV